ncbi:unnamed protein product, partial [Allacma fusca]
SVQQRNVKIARGNVTNGLNIHGSTWTSSNNNNNMGRRFTKSEGSTTTTTTTTARGHDHHHQQRHFSHSTPFKDPQDQTIFISQQHQYHGQVHKNGSGGGGGCGGEDYSKKNYNKKTKFFTMRKSKINRTVFNESFFNAHQGLTGWNSDRSSADSSNSGTALETPSKLFWVSL